MAVSIDELKAVWPNKEQYGPYCWRPKSRRWLRTTFHKAQRRYLKKDLVKQTNLYITDRRMRIRPDDLEIVKSV